MFEHGSYILRTQKIGLIWTLPQILLWLGHAKFLKICIYNPIHTSNIFYNLNASLLVEKLVQTTNAYAYND
jgi:hypothetical protein